MNYLDLLFRKSQVSRVEPVDKFSELAEEACRTQKTSLRRMTALKISRASVEMDVDVSFLSQVIQTVRVREDIKLLIMLCIFPVALTLITFFDVM